MTVVEVLAEVVRSLRERAVLSQEELAERSGLSVGTIRGIESGRIRRPRQTSLRGLADALGADGAGFERLLAAVYGQSNGAATPPAGTRPAPAQLPAAVAGFAGRMEALAALDELLPREGPPHTAVVISAVAGTPGIGKTALAVHWAHRVAHRFPDGQLYVNLQGFDPAGRALPAAEAVRGFLDALGVPAEGIPSDLDTQAALYRSLVAGKRLLVLLDNARDAEQVRPLLPGSPTVAVVVTSRDRLTPLVVTEGARPLPLDLLSTRDARELLAARLGGDCVAAEPEAVDAIVLACARLPLALAIAAARARQSGFPLRAIAAELADARQRLDALDVGGPSGQIRAVLSWSYAALSPPAARMFRLLGLHPGPDISAAAAASLAARPPGETRRLLAALVRASLVTEPAPGRYAWHDLLRAYAAERAEADDGEADRRAALTRVLDHYAHTAHTANRLLAPHSDPIPVPLAPAAPGATAETLAGTGEALAWLEAEHPVLLAAARHAAGAGLPAYAWQLAWGLDTFLVRGGYWHQRATAWDTALRAAVDLANPYARAFAHRLMANAELELGNYDRADDHYGRALALSERIGHRVEHANVRRSLAFLRERQGRPDQALHHSRVALKLFREAGHRRGEARSLNAIGWYHALLDEHLQAIRHCRQALALSRRLGDAMCEAATWDSLGYAYGRLGNQVRAIDCHRRSLVLFRRLGWRHGQADALTHLGDVHDATDDREAARRAWRQALDILTETQHPDAPAVQSKLDLSAAEA